jgi:RNA polymerase sigma-70 factor (ECF subfamily)
MDQVDHDELYDPEIFNQIKEAIASLPPQMAEIFKLKYIECKRIAEIAQLNKISENTVKTQLLRAKSKMRKVLLETTSIKFLF